MVALTKVCPFFKKTHYGLRCVLKSPYYKSVYCTTDYEQCPIWQEYAKVRKKFKHISYENLGEKNEPRQRTLFE